VNRFTYTRVGAYWIPELKLMEQSLHPIGKYGRMRRRYLKECRPMLYSHLILTGGSIRTWLKLTRQQIGVWSC
jgi:hypothetical protein